MKAIAELAIIVPCYNEEDVLPQSIKTLSAELDKMIKSKLVKESSKIVFINDGSADSTWAIIEKHHKKNPHIKGISLSRNFGHQEALLAGLYNTDADIYITVDADLQDDISVIPQMIEHFYKGFDIVYGVRNRRDTDSFFKRSSALCFYKLMKLLGVELISNHADNPAMFTITAKNARPVLPNTRSKK